MGCVHRRRHRLRVLGNRLSGRGPPLPCAGARVRLRGRPGRGSLRHARRHRGSQAALDRVRPGDDPRPAGLRRPARGPGVGRRPAAGGPRRAARVHLRPAQGPRTRPSRASRGLGPGDDRPRVPGEGRRRRRRRAPVRRRRSGRRARPRAAGQPGGRRRPVGVAEPGADGRPRRAARRGPGRLAGRTVRRPARPPRRPRGARGARTAPRRRRGGPARRPARDRRARQRPVDGRVHDRAGAAARTAPGDPCPRAAAVRSTGRGARRAAHLPRAARRGHRPRPEPGAGAPGAGDPAPGSRAHGPARGAGCGLLAGDGAAVCPDGSGRRPGRRPAGAPCRAGPPRAGLARPRDGDRGAGDRQVLAGAAPRRRGQGERGVRRLRDLLAGRRRAAVVALARRAARSGGRHRGRPGRRWGLPGRRHLGGGRRVRPGAGRVPDLGPDRADRARGRPAPTGSGRPRRPPLGRRGHPARLAAPRLGDPGRRATRRRRHASSPPRADRRPGRRRRSARPAAGPARRADRPGRGRGDRAGDGRRPGVRGPDHRRGVAAAVGRQPLLPRRAGPPRVAGRRGPGHRPRGRQPTAGGTAGRHAGDAAGGRGRRPVLPRRDGRRRPAAGRRGRRGRPRAGPSGRRGRGPRRRGVRVHPRSDPRGRDAHPVPAPARPAPRAGRPRAGDRPGAAGAGQRRRADRGAGPSLAGQRTDQRRPGLARGGRGGRPGAASHGIPGGLGSATGGDSEPRAGARGEPRGAVPTAARAGAGLRLRRLVAHGQRGVVCGDGPGPRPRPTGPRRAGRRRPQPLLRVDDPRLDGDLGGRGGRPALGVAGPARGRLGRTLHAPAVAGRRALLRRWGRGRARRSRRCRPRPRPAAVRPGRAGVGQPRGVALPLEPVAHPRPARAGRGGPGRGSAGRRPRGGGRRSSGPGHRRPGAVRTRAPGRNRPERPRPSPSASASRTCSGP